MQLDHDVVLAIQLAGELHEIGTLLGGDEEPSDAATAALAGDDDPRVRAARRLPTIVESMDERFDGSWIPLGRAGEKIPIGARILAVADDLETALEGRSRATRRSRPQSCASRRGRGPSVRSLRRAGRAAHAGAAPSRTATVARVSATLIARSLAAGHGDRALFSGLDLVVAPATTSSGSSVRTARASRRCSRSSPACSAPEEGTRRAEPAHARASATCRRSPSAARVRASAGSSRAARASRRRRLRWSARPARSPRATTGAEADVRRRARALARPRRRRSRRARRRRGRRAGPARDRSTRR